MLEIYSDVTVPKIIEIGWYSTKLLQKQKVCSFLETQYTLPHKQGVITLLQITDSCENRLVFGEVTDKIMVSPFLSRVSTAVLIRDIDIAFLSVCHVPVLYLNGLTYRHIFFSVC